MIGYAGKRGLDLLLVALSLPLVLPLATLIGAAVWLFIGKPLVFRQLRPGLHGRPFQLLKFRTMTDARDAAGRLLPDDQRLTAFGRLLRSTSLDELPELLNVVRGDMSIVGPRPLLMEYVPLYSARHARRHDVRPGLTGLAQVAGRNAISWTEKFEYDVEYVERCSLRLDLAILVRTVATVLRREGIAAPGAATAPKFQGYDDGRAATDGIATR